jgi:hypothetical protein
LNFTIPQGPQGVAGAGTGDVVAANANTFTTNQVISGSSASALLRITQTGAGNALVVEDEANPDSTPFVVTANGTLVSGYTSTLPTGLQYRVQVAALDAAAGLSASRYSANAGAPVVAFGKSRSASTSSFSIVSSADNLGVIDFRGDDGAAFISAAQIAAQVDGTPGLNDMPGRLIFSTTADGASSVTERMRINSAGEVGIGGGTVTSIGFRLGKQITGAINAYGMTNQGVVQSDVTSSAYSYYSGFGTQATTFTLGNLIHYAAVQGTVGVGSTVTEQIGFYVSPGTTGATSNFGFRSAIPAAANRWNLYMDGSANNYMLGRLGVGATLTTGAMAQITNTTAADVALIVKGAASQTGDLLDVQNSAGTSQFEINSAGLIGIRDAAVTGRSMNIGGALTGGTFAYHVASGPQISSDVTNTASIFVSLANTAAASFTLSTFNHFHAVGVATPGAGSTITNQYGFHATNAMTGATNNYGFFGNIASGTGRYNLFMNGTADNYLAGSLGIGSVPAAGRNLTISKAITGSTTSIAVLSSGAVQSDVTGEVASFRSNVTTAAASFTLATLSHYQAVPSATAGAGSTITTQIGFNVASTMTSATNNYGFFGDLAAAANRWNLYMSGTAANHLAGNLCVGTTAIATSANKAIHMGNGTAPTANIASGGILYVESGALKYRGSSGTITTLGAA